MHNGSFLPQDFCPSDRLCISQGPNVLDFEHPESSLRHAPSRLCWCHFCLTMICNSVRQDRRLFFLPQRFLPARISQVMPWTRSCTVWHQNVNALASTSVSTCAIRRRKPPGESMRVDVGKLSRRTQPFQLKPDSLHMLLQHWQSMINKQTFYSVWYLLLSLTRFLSGVWVLVLVVNEVGQSMTEIQSKQMALCLHPLPRISSQQWIPQALRRL